MYVYVSHKYKQTKFCVSFSSQIPTKTKTEEQNKKRHLQQKKKRKTVKKIKSKIK